ncbi:MAG: C10 family peptidase, partial [Muribaculaceae bacterium]|nr:C10 family peptidase [Muribaculaceae bacterium]
MKKLIYFLLFALVGLTGCQSYEPKLTDTAGDTGVSSAYDEIISRANFYYGMLPGKTRANAPSVSDVMPILTGNTRSTDNEGESPMYYIVNYENEEGFVIVGGNDRAYPLLAVSDEASLTEEDIDNIFPLKSFISNSSTLTSVIDTLYQEPEKAFNISIAPKLHPYVRKWGQGAPFNSYTPLINGQNALVGCVPLAVGMLMSYYEWPTEHKGRTINWKIIKNGYCSALGILLAELGEASNIDTRYGLEGSSSIFSNVPGTMKNYDYLTNRENIDLFNIHLYPNEECKEEMKKYLPLIMCGRGYSKRDGKTGGHSWIIDGLLHIPYDPD